jgi:hypothetical protein
MTYSRSLSFYSFVGIWLPLSVAYADDLTANSTPLSKEAVSEKAKYTLINPTPDDQMREFSTDRPGKTHSSTTVDAGHFQLESDFVNHTYDHYSKDGQTTHAYSIATPILKLGVTNWMDIEGGFALFNKTRITDSNGNVSQRGSGFGDFLLGSKINLFGNDGGDQSLALLPFIKFPTASNNIGNGVVEYSLNVPYTIALSEPWSITIEPALGYLKNYSDNGLHGDYSFLVNLNRPIFIKTLTAALEFASEFSADRNIPSRYTVDPSLQWVVSPGVQLDVGMYIGLNKAAPDYISYSGISFRY